MGAFPVTSTYALWALVVGAGFIPIGLCINNATI